MTVMPLAAQVMAVFEPMFVGVGVIVVVRLARRMIMSMMLMTMMMVMTLRQQKGAQEIDDQAQDRNQDGLVERHGCGRDKPLGGFNCNGEGDDAQHQSRRKTGKVANLARAEGEARVARVTAGKGVSEGGHGEGAGMGRHMNTVRQQRH